MAIDEWSTTAGNNASGVTGVSWAEGQAPSTVNDSARATMADVAAWYARLQKGYSAENLTLTASVGSNNLTIAIKTLAGADPSSTDKVRIPFRSATAATGDYTIIGLSAATSIVVSSGATLGVANNVAFRGWVVGFNDGGTFRLGVINCVSTTAGAGAGRDVTAIYKLQQFGIASSTQVGAGATSAQTFYTNGAGVSSKAYTVLGYFTYESGLATAGTYASTPTRLDLFRLGMPLPGMVVQTQRTDTGAMATGSTTVPEDDTIPQNTEGDQYMTQAITPSSAANALRVRSEGCFASGVSADVAFATSLYQDSTANALRTTQCHPNVGGSPSHAFKAALDALILASTTSSTTFAIRAGFANAGTTTFNGTGGARKYGGVLNSFIEVTEVMG